MKFRLLALGLGMTLLPLTPTWGQQPRSQTAELRKQIEALQKKLETLENEEPRNTRVTRIGGGRARQRISTQSVRIYDLGDLFTIAPTYVAQHAGDLTKERRAMFAAPSAEYQGTGGYGGLGGGFGGGGFFNVGGRGRPKSLKPPRQRVLKQGGGEAPGSGAARTKLDDLINVIKQVIAPEVWTEGGGTATIAKLGNALLISADEQTHEQVDQLLNTFRKRWGTLRTVSVRADWVWLTDKQLAALLSKPGQGDPKPGEVRAYGLVDETAWEKHLQQLEQDADKTHPGYRASLTCYNGQTVHTLSGGQSLAVTQIRPVLLKGDDEKPGGRVAYRPEVTMIQEGVALQVTPIANLSGKTVVLDAHSRVCLSEKSAAPAADAPAKKAKAGDGASPRDVVSVIDRPKLAIQRLSTTLRVPVNRTMLVGGMSFGGTKNNSGQLYLFVKVAVQELRNDQPEPAKPAPAKKGGVAKAEKPAAAR